MKHILGDNTASKLIDINITKDMIQPNAIDLRVKNISKIVNGVVILHGDVKQHLKRVDVASVDGMYILEGGCKYDVVFDGNIEIAHKEAGFVIVRSTLNRNGIVVTSGLYDSGYNNIIGGMLHIPEGVTLHIGENERLAQFLLFDAESIGLYNGYYNKMFEVA